MPRFDSLPQDGARPLSTAKAACRRSSSVAGTAPAAPNSRSCSRPRRCARRASRDLETEAGRGATRRLLGFLLIGGHRKILHRVSSPFVGPCLLAVPVKGNGAGV